MRYNSIRPGREWLDVSGKPIQAHGFQVFYNEQEKLWYWYGENKEDTKKGGTVWTKGIRYYTSRDLCNWEDRGYLIPPAEDLNDPLHPTYCIDRPHIIYCEKTGKYVCWIKVMAGEISQFMTVLTADRFEGPYTYANRIYKPLKMDSGDFALHVDRGVGQTPEHSSRESPAAVLRKSDLRRPPQQVHRSLPLWRLICGRRVHA
jgi:hypothetical protein